MKFDIQKWYNNRLNDDIIVDYYGSITGEVIDAVLESMEVKLNLSGYGIAKRKKIFNVFIECLQNLYHHVDTPPIGEDVVGIKNFGIIILKKEGDYHKIITGNYLNSEKVQKIKGRIKQLNALTKDEIKALYLDILFFEGHTLKGGAGLGLLDILRKSGGKLDCIVHKINKDFSFFSLEVIIK